MYSSLGHGCEIPGGVHCLQPGGYCPDQAVGGRLPLVGMDRSFATVLASGMSPLDVEGAIGRALVRQEQSTMAPAATMVHRHQVDHAKLCLVLYSLNFIGGPFGNLQHSLTASLGALPESSSKRDNQTKNGWSRLAVRERVLRA